MQHLDEGTIHSWLDTALSADEAARIEAHLGECSQCAAAVAEARGFIAAASRILTALDNAPRGVIPAAAPKKRVDPLVWRVAATVLVVAAGTLVVVQNRGGNERPLSIPADSAMLSTQRTSVAEQISAATGPAAAAADGAAPKAAVINAPTPALSGKAETRSFRAEVAARENKALAAGTTARIGQNAAGSGYAVAAAPTAPAISQSRVAGGVALNTAIEPEPLKVVGTPRRIGAKVTLYEVTPGDTVTLTESMPLNLDQVVVTGAAGAAGAPTARRATAKMAAPPSRTLADVAIVGAPDSQRAAAAAPPAASAPAPLQVEMANTLHTLSWTDSTTGNALALTGRMPEARLREVKIRIERERATAAAKKSP